MPSIRTGPQLAAVLIVLLAIFTLPCCPRIDGFFLEAAAAVSSPTPSAIHDHHHHAGHESGLTEQVDGGSTETVHKGHLMSTGSVDALPLLAPFSLAARLSLSRVGATTLLSVVPLRAPRIPVPPPRISG